jgi:hypothetical protein
MKRIITLTLSLGAAVGMALGGLAAGDAATALPAGTVHGCVNLHNNRTLDHVYTLPDRGTSCPAGEFLVYWPAKPSASAPDTNGSLAGSWTLANPTARTSIGGPIQANGTDLGTLTLPAGKYLINANAMFTRTAAEPDGPDTFPELTVWQGTTWAPDFSNTVGTWLGGMMSRNIYIDDTASGSTIVTIPAGGDTLHVVGFAYDEDRSSTGAVQVDTASLSAVRVG